MSQALSVYITAGSRDEARRIARALIEARLAACVNILGPVESSFYWNGVEQEEEVALVAKALDGDFDALAACVRQVHSYDCPCIVAWPISRGEPAYLRWIEEETRGRREGPV